MYIFVRGFRFVFLFSSEGGLYRLRGEIVVIRCVRGVKLIRVWDFRIIFLI